MVDFDKMTMVEPREGDVLVVSYPEISVQYAPFCSCKIGGLIYTRRLLPGDDVDRQYEKIYTFLKRKAEADGKAKLEALAADLEEAKRR